ncbi:MAG: DNA polymerase III subunit beta [Thermoflexales bacterium]|nr:DNA polymerase III subunit beta [Thermoflexales bacterium]
MKVSVMQENLAKGLGIVARAVAGNRAPLPVLTHILLATENGRLRIAATNLELAINCWIGAKIESEGAICVPARTFSELVSLLPSDVAQLDLNIRTQSLRVMCGRTDNNIKGIDAQEFPIIPTFTPTNVAYVDPDVLRKMINKVVFAAATDENRPMLTGVLTRIEGQSLTLAASDGFRVSECRGALKSPVTDPLAILIPAKAVAEVGRLIGDQTEPVAITVTPSGAQALFHLDHADVIAQLIDQRFPDYANVIPRAYNTRTVVNTAELLKACKQASVFARDSNNLARIQIEPGEDGAGKVKITAQAQETGDNQSELEGIVNGPGVEIGFDARFLVDVASVVDTPQLAIETSAPKAPGVIRPIGDDGFLHVVMPMHLAR